MDGTPVTPRIGVRTRNLSDRRLRYLRQLGATDIFVDHADTDEEPDEFNDREAAETIAVGPTRSRRSRNSRPHANGSRARGFA
jgi:mannonate dehydratase